MNEKLPILREKAMRLPLNPGVYVMKNSKGEIIYIGKAKALKNRVSQYFGSQNRHQIKVLKMVENVNDFDVILTDSEFEALVLECSLIKQHSPKYNILLKDDKGYSYIKITKGEYPKISAVFQKENDDAEYLGPYTSSFTARQSVDEALKIFKLPQCNKDFPRDIRSTRPCLNFYISQCSGVCNGKLKKSDYNEAVNSAIEFLKGDSKKILAKLKNDMETAAENLDFEKAAKLRDRINAIEKLKQKQKVYSNIVDEQDVFAIAKDKDTFCLMVLNFKSGRLFDSKDFIFKDDEENLELIRSNLISSYYSNHSVIPKRITLDGGVEDKELLERFLSEKKGKKVEITFPQRSEQAEIVKLCYENAVERLAQNKGKSAHSLAVLDELASLLGMSTPPEYIESYDISHTAGVDNVGAMVVFKDGKPYKKAYKKFTIKGFTGQDDYASMNEVLTRRFNEYENNKNTGEGFGKLPDLILLDGGLGQVNAVKSVLEQFNLTSVPLFGMVKDNKHRTRAIAYNGGEIAINSNRRVFSLITEIQDEVHRFAISFHHQKHQSRSFASKLTEIEGIGEKKAKELLKHFKTTAAIKNATVEELEKASGINKNLAGKIFNYFHTEN